MLWASAHASGTFADEIVAMEVKTKKGPKVCLLAVLPLWWDMFFLAGWRCYGRAMPAAFGLACVTVRGILVGVKLGLVGELGVQDAYSERHLDGDIFKT